MNVLSLFDGISSGKLILEQLGIPVELYYSSEIDEKAIAISEHNHKDIIRLGDVQYFRDWDIVQPDLLLASPPCQAFSMAGKQLNFEDPRGQLFFTAIQILEAYKPKYFFFENVVMKSEYSDRLSELLGVEPVVLCSADFGYQSRTRLYWTNIPYTIPEIDGDAYDYEHILEEGERPCKMSKASDGYQRLNFRKDKKFPTLTTVPTCAMASKSLERKPIAKEVDYRYLNVNDWEAIQGLPKGYVENVPRISMTNKKKSIGNGWDIYTVSMLLEGLRSSI